jgi:type I restriction enzyme, S subunit
MTWTTAPLLKAIELHDSRRIPLNASERAKRKGSYPYYGANGLVDHVDDYIFDGDYVLLAEDGGNFDKPERGVAYEVSGKFWVNNHAHILKPIPACVSLARVVPPTWRSGGSKADAAGTSRPIS